MERSNEAEGGTNVAGEEEACWEDLEGKGGLELEGEEEEEKGEGMTVALRAPIWSIWMGVRDSEVRVRATPLESPLIAMLRAKCLLVLCFLVLTLPALAVLLPSTVLSSAPDISVAGVCGTLTSSSEFGLSKSRSAACAKIVSASSHFSTADNKSPRRCQ
jgi:hypothetical protein